MLKYFFLTLIFFSVLFFTPPVQARIGVGVGTGKIIIDEALKAGTIYQLPSLTVLNTGDEPSMYEAGLTFHDGQTQRRIPLEWISFSPQQFHLDPTQVQVVEIKLNLPLKAIPGDYFGYLEGHPLKKAQSGVTSIGVAAASKFYFTVAPTSFLQGVYYKIISFWKIYQPWTNRSAALVALILFIITFKHFFKFQIGIKKKDQS